MPLRIRFIAISVAVLNLVGCPNPKGQLFFKVGDKWTQRPKIKLTSTAHISVAAEGYYSSSRATYEIEFICEASSKRDSIQINPCQISIQFNGTPMTYRSSRMEQKNCWKAADGPLDYSFYCHPDLTKIPRDSLGNFLILPFQVILSNAFRVRGQPVSIDTLFAVDRKTNAGYY